MDNIQKFSNNVKSLCKERNILLKQVLQDCNLNKDFLSSAIKRNTLPSGDNLFTLAEYFDVSIDYLVGRTENPEVNS